jgi:hypothetical protein
MKESLKDSGEMTTGISTYLNLHLMLIKTTIDIRVLYDFKLNFTGFRHGEFVERRHLTCHVIKDL